MKEFVCRYRPHQTATHGSDIQGRRSSTLQWTVGLICERRKKKKKKKRKKEGKKEKKKEERRKKREERKKERVKEEERRRRKEKEKRRRERRKKREEEEKRRKEKRNEMKEKEKTKKEKTFPTMSSPPALRLMGRSSGSLVCSVCGSFPVDLYCATCKQHLCTTCSGVHAKLGATRSHLTSDNLAGGNSATSSEPSSPLLITSPDRPDSGLLAKHNLRSSLKKV